MPIDRFERSNAETTFDEYESDDSFIAWIDLLGVRKLNHNELKAVINKALLVVAQASSTGPIVNGTLIGTPQSAIQYTIVGDAIVLVPKDQPSTPGASALAFLWRVGVLSKLLFSNGLIHRGAVTRGPMIAMISNGNQIITGAGVVRAVALESSIKATGIYYDEKCLGFISSRKRQIDTQLIISEKKDHCQFLWFFSTRFLSGVLVEKDGGLEAWRDALENALPHKYVLRSKKIISKIKTP